MAENKHIAGKEKTAVAVAYNPGEVAPKILAVGKGEVAERIIETAKDLIQTSDRGYDSAGTLRGGRGDPCLCGRYGPHEGKTQRIRLTVGR